MVNEILLKIFVFFSGFCGGFGGDTGRRRREGYAETPRKGVLTGAGDGVPPWKGRKARSDGDGAGIQLGSKREFFKPGCRRPGPTPSCRRARRSPRAPAQTASAALWSA